MRSRIAGLSVLLLILVFLVSGSVLYLLFEKNQIEVREYRLMNMADTLMLEISNHPDRFMAYPQDFLSVPGRTIYSGIGVFVQFNAVDGTVLAKSPSLKTENLPFLTREDDLLQDLKLGTGDNIKIYQREILVSGQSLGYVVVGTTMTVLYQSLTYFRNLLILVMLVAFLIILGGVYLLLNLSRVRETKQFLSYISHELRTPLAVIQGHAELGLASSEKKSTDVLNVILLEAKFLRQMVNNLLLLFRHQLTGYLPPKGPVFLHDMLTELVLALQSDYREKPISLTLGEAAVFDGYPDAIRHMLRNLLENAIRHTSMSDSVFVTMHTVAGAVQIVVSDNGQGVPLSQQKDLFRPFASSQSGSTGLGLAICAWAVHLHKGRIWYENRAGFGATFVVSIPL